MFALNSISNFCEQGRESKQIWFRMSTLLAPANARMWKSGYHVDRKKPKQKCTLLFVVQGNQCRHNETIHRWDKPTLPISISIQSDRPIEGELLILLEFSINLIEFRSDGMLNGWTGYF